MKRLTLLSLLCFFFQFASAQNIGIGTPAPDYTLDINGTVGINNLIYHNDDENDDTWIGFPGVDTFEIVVGGFGVFSANGTSNQLIVNPNSTNTEFIVVADGIEHLIHANPVTREVGIGTSSPLYLLDVDGSFRVIGDQIEHLFYVDAPADKLGIGTNAPSYLVDVAGDFRVIGDGIEHLFYVDAANGRVGIGTATPNYELEVNGLISSDNIRVGGNPLPQLASIQTGSENSLFNEPGNNAHTVTVVFPQPFSTTPNILATIENIGGETEDSYFTSVRIASPTQVTFNVGIYGTGGPADSLKLTWMAWE